MVNLLYIDDDAGLARLLAKALGVHGITVSHAENGNDALLKLAGRSFDAIALDHILASESGLDIMFRIRSEGHSQPIIYVTGSEDVHVAVAALKAGAADYVWKDVDGHYRELLVRSIGAAMRQQQLAAEKEEALRAILDAKNRAEMMLAEVNHRVANSLALVASLASLQSNVVTDPAAKAALNEMKARITAIAGIHRRLYTSSDVRTVALDAYLRTLGGELVAVLGADERRHRIEVLTDADILISTDRAISLAVIVTELVTNALKYAYPDNVAGDIRVRLHRVEADHLQLAVEDDGVGWAGNGEIKGSGLGSRIIKAMAKSLDGELVYKSAGRGTRAVIEFPREIARN